MPHKRMHVPPRASNANSLRSVAMPKRPRSEASDGGVGASAARRVRKDGPVASFADSAATAFSDDELDAEMVAAGLLAPGEVYGDGDGGAGGAQPVNNIPALKAGLAAVRKDLPWLERLDVVSAESMAGTEAVDDLKIEMGL